MQDQDVRSLSKSSLWDITNSTLNPNASQSASPIHRGIILQILQILSSDENSNSQPDKPANKFLVLSDSVYCDKFLFYANAAKKFEEMSLKPNDVLQCNIVSTKGKALVVIDFNVTSLSVPSQIGDPTDISECNSRLPDGHITADIPRSRQPVISNNKSSYQNESQDSDRNQYNPISMLNIYSMDFMIRGRVLKKDQLRTFNSAKGQGHVFSVQIMDDSQVPMNIIKATFFNEMAVKFHGELEEKKVYIFCSGDLKPKNAKFNNTRHQCEIIFNKKSSIMESADAGHIAEETYNFELLNMINSYDKYHTLDILVVVKTVAEPEEINLRAGGTTTKRTVSVYDESGLAVDFSVWGNMKGEEHLAPGTIVAVRNVSVNEFRGRCLSSKSDTYASTDFPQDLTRYKELLQFCESGTQIHSLNPERGAEGSTYKPRYIKTFREIEDDAAVKFGSVHDDDRKKPIFYNAMGIVSYIPGKNLYYNACPVDKCAKKLTESGDGHWQCEKCGGTFDKPMAKYIGKAKLTDDSNSIYVTINTDKVGQKVIGKTAQETAEALDGPMSDSEDFTTHLRDRCMIDYYFTLMVKQEYYMGDWSTKYYLINAEKAEENYPRCIKTLLSNIEAYDSMVNNMVF
jgi:replication factor A1